MIRVKYLIIATLLVFIVPYVLLGVFAYFRAESIIFQPQIAKQHRSTPKLIFDFLELITPSGEKISASFHENKNAEFTILYSHGNAEDLLDYGVFRQQLNKSGFNVFAYDYRGYGTSEGKPSEKNAYEDIETAYNYLVNEMKIPPEKIIIHGRSLGGAVSIDLASRQKCGGLIVESSFVSAFKVFLKVPLFPFDKFESINKIGNVKCPILFIHGKKDSLIPFWHSEKLFEKANEPKFLYLVENANHNDLVQIGGRNYYESIQKFSSELQK